MRRPCGTEVPGHAQATLFLTSVSYKGTEARFCFLSLLFYLVSVIPPMMHIYLFIYPSVPIM
jgi:hypothetical protein